jgi:hypothetical protein
MKKLFFLTVFCLGYAILHAQNITTTDSSENNVVINKDPRLDILAKNEADINNANGALSGGNVARGYRLMLLNTSDRALAMKVRAKLLQNFPDQKVYMSFQPPYIKVKFGDFLDKDDADNYKTQISNARIVTGNIYIVPELIEIKPDKTSQPAN